MPIDFSHISVIGLGIALSACCGFRVFIPLLAASIASFSGWVDLSSEMQWMGSLPALICFATATVVEVLAFYIPFIDNLLDTIAAPLSVVAGTLLAFSILPIAENESLLRWSMSLLAGGATAGTIQMGTGLLRLFSSKATVGTGNAVVASGENVAAISGTVFSFIVPVVAALVVLILVIYILSKLIGRLVR